MTISGIGFASEPKVKRSFAPDRACNHSDRVNVGKWLVVIGLVTAGIGALLWLGVGRGWLGRLPGDIHYTRGNVSFHFPLVTCLLISAVLTVLMWLFRR